MADTADVIIFNLLDKEMDFVNCQTNESGTIGVFPRTIPPQQVGRFFINTTRIAQTVSGDCWWSIPGAALGGQNRGCHAGTSSRLRRGPPLRSCALISVRDQPSILFIKKVLFELQVAARRQQNARAPRP